MSKIVILPSQAELQRLFDYDPETGCLRWKRRSDVSQRWNTRYAGSIINYRNDAGYICVRLGKRLLRTHRIIWKLVTGHDPGDEIDHFNLDRADNKWDNLREATSGLNKANKPAQKNNACGLKGAYLDKQSRRWYSQIQFAGKQYNLGRFDTAEEAHAAYAEATQKFNGEFGRAA